MDKKDDEELNILTYDTSGDTFDVSLLMIEDDTFEEEATADKGEHETTICDKFYKFKLDSSITRDMIRLVYKGKMLSEKKTMKEHNIEAEETIEMSLRLLGGMDVSEQMDTHETEEDRKKKRKLEKGKEGKATKSNDDMIFLKRDIMEALKRSDEKWKATQERLMTK